MTANLLAAIRNAGSFIAGLLIGVAIVVAAFALTDMESGAWQTGLAVGAPLILVVGLALQVLATAPRGRADLRSVTAASIA